MPIKMVLHSRILAAYVSLCICVLEAFSFHAVVCTCVVCNRLMEDSGSRPQKSTTMYLSTRSPELGSWLKDITRRDKKVDKKRQSSCPYDEVTNLHMDHIEGLWREYVAFNGLRVIILPMLSIL